VRSILTQQEADTLLKIEKYYRDDKQFTFPYCGEKLEILLYSNDEREEFIMSIESGRIKLTKNTFQTRTRRSIVLVRLEINGAPHRNPDGEEIACPHLHLYREGFDDKWATPLPDFFKNPDDAWETLNEFMDFCAVITKPIINKELFT